MRRRAFRRSASLLVQNDLFLCIVCKDRCCLSLSSTAVLATTLDSISLFIPFVNTFFQKSFQPQKSLKTAAAQGFSGFQPHFPEKKFFIFFSGRIDFF